MNSAAEQYCLNPRTELCTIDPDYSLDLLHHRIPARLGLLETLRRTRQDPNIDQNSLVVQILCHLSELDRSKLFRLTSHTDLEWVNPQRRIGIVSCGEMDPGWVLRCADGILAWVDKAPVVEQPVHDCNVALYVAHD